MILLPNRQSSLADRACGTIPAATVFVSMLLMMLPFPLAIGALPNMALLFVIIWAILQPRLMPVWLAFLLGLLHDMISGMAPGHMGLIFTIAVAAVRLAEARFDVHNLVVDWAFTAVVVLFTTFLSWQLWAFVGMPATLWPMLVQAALTIASYPVAIAIAAHLQRKILQWIN